MNQLLPSQLKSPDSLSQYLRAIQKYEAVTHLRLYCWSCLHTVTLRATQSFVPHVLPSLEVIQKSDHYTTSLPHATLLWIA